ncbi:exodeoxyribonuclease V subunit alpha [Piscinibacter sakaiensis]|uniref:exodeoxyribonuclease V subunit alpha n=1 Tax=Piscinibacter sakaiensis TaxID=1547922 RepID=UPI003AAE26B4
MSAVPVDPQARLLLGELARWSEQGWLRRLDTAFARFVVELCPASPPPVVLAAALLAFVEGRGHSCLPIDALFENDEAAGLLGLAPPAAAALRQQLRGLPQAPAGWLEALRASPLVRVDDGHPVDAAAQARPLVLAGSRLYLRRYWHYEQGVAAQVALRAGHFLPVDRGAVRAWLDRLFRSAEPGGAAKDFDWQKAACGLALTGSLSVITGGPGTGKTYTAARLLALLFAVDPAPQQLRIALAAPTGKAAARLRQAIADALLSLQQAVGAELDIAALAERIGPARTLHSLLGARPDTRRFGHDAAHPLEVDVLIVDEASMIHLEMMAALFDALPAGARVILLGDKDQLASVEAGAVLGDLCRDAETGRYRPDTAALLSELTGADLPDCFVDATGPALAQHTVMLRSSRRFGGPIGQLALAVNRGDVSAAEALLQSPPDSSLRWLDGTSTTPLLRLASGAGKAAAGGGYRSYLVTLKQRPPAAAGQDAFDNWVASVLKAFERFRVLCAVREGEWGAVGLNRAIEETLFADAASGIAGRRAGGGWYEGRPVLVTRNDAALGVFNGDIGITLRPFADAGSGRGASANAPLRAWFADGDSGLRSVAVSRLAAVDTAFAMTVHKAQGSEFEHCVLVLPQLPSRVLARELVYTGITRARRQFTLVTGRRQALAEAVAARTVRSSGLLSDGDGV